MTSSQVQQPRASCLLSCPLWFCYIVHLYFHPAKEHMNFSFIFYLEFLQTSGPATQQKVRRTFTVSTGDKPLIEKEKVSKNIHEYLLYLSCWHEPLLTWFLCFFVHFEKNILWLLVCYFLSSPGGDPWRSRVHRGRSVFLTQSFLPSWQHLAAFTTNGLNQQSWKRGRRFRGMFFRFFLHVATWRLRGSLTN